MSPEVFGTSRHVLVTLLSIYIVHSQNWDYATCREIRVLDFREFSGATSGFGSEQRNYV